MAEENVGSGEPQDEEVVDLFAEDHDDKKLLEPESEDGDEGHETPSTDEVGDSDDVPEKFKGKSLKDVIASYQSLEQEFGRRNNEVGELRQQVNSIIERQLAQPTSSGDDDDDLDYDENPKAAVAKAVSESAEIKEIREALVKTERDRGLAKFQDAHPDADKVIADPRFQDWVRSSATRVRLFNEADKNYDYDVATDLLNDYKAMVGVKEEAATGERDNKVKALKNAPASSGGATKGKRRMYKASDLIKLKNSDPQRYERLQPEINRAYQEGRVIRDLY